MYITIERFVYNATYFDAVIYKKFNCSALIAVILLIQKLPFSFKLITNIAAYTFSESRTAQTVLSIVSISSRLRSICSVSLVSGKHIIFSLNSKVFCVISARWHAKLCTLIGIVEAYRVEINWILVTTVTDGCTTTLTVSYFVISNSTFCYTTTLTICWLYDYTCNNENISI